MTYMQAAVLIGPVRQRSCMVPMIQKPNTVPVNTYPPITESAAVLEECDAFPQDANSFTNASNRMRHQSQDRAGTYLCASTFLGSRAPGKRAPGSRNNIRGLWDFTLYKLALTRPSATLSRRERDGGPQLSHAKTYARL